MKNRVITAIATIACFCLVACANKRAETSTENNTLEVENVEMQSIQDTPESISECIQKMYADIFSRYSATNEGGWRYGIDNYVSAELKKL